MSLGSGLMRTRCSSPLYNSSCRTLTREGVVVSMGLRCVGVLTMSGPEGLDTVDTPLPLALWGVWWCSTPRWGSETRVAA
eukprot:5137844-Pleurochrysis_carterae.AAC.1